MWKTRVASLALVVLAAAVVAPAAKAAVDIDFGAAVNVNDRTSLFFSISSRYFEHDRATVASYGERFADPDDLAVALFVQRRSGRTMDEIWRLRTTGSTWWDISLRFGVPADAWFVPVRRDPGPPYGRAYGHWKKHKHHPSSMVVSDIDARNLVVVRMLHDYYGVSAEIAMQWRAGGRKAHDLLAEEYQRRHGTAAAPVSQSGKSTGNGRRKKP